MKKNYIPPQIDVVLFDMQNIVCTSPLGPNGEGIEFGGEEGDEEIYHPSNARGIWKN